MFGKIALPIVILDLCFYLSSRLSSEVSLLRSVVYLYGSLARVLLIAVPD